MCVYIYKCIYTCVFGGRAVNGNRLVLWCSFLKTMLCDEAPCERFFCFGVFAREWGFETVHCGFALSKTGRPEGKLWSQRRSRSKGPQVEGGS